MTDRPKSKILSGSIMVLLNILISRWLTTSFHNAGLSSFLAFQTRRFTKHYALPESFVATAVWAAVLACAWLALYEAVAFGIYVLIRREKVGNGT
jgi:hypothetical protein